MSDSNLPVVRLNGRKFIAIKPEDPDGGCEGCVADDNHEDDWKLCGSLPKCAGRNFNHIYKEIH